MRSEVDIWMYRLKQVEREYQTARLAMDRLEWDARDDPAVLTQTMSYRDIGLVTGRLEETYLVRLFSEFEAALRQFLRVKRLRVPGNARPLINRVVDKVRIANRLALDVHRVRDYRNSLVHETEALPASVSIREATSILCGFLYW